MFDVVNKGEMSYFNLCKNVSFNTEDLDPSLYQDYYVQDTDTWTGISYKFYKTYKLWWLVCKFNGVLNPLEDPKGGTLLKIPSNDLIDTIITVLKQQ